jgi:hypothetical protein
LGDVLIVKCVWVFGMLGVVTTPASVSFGDVVIDTVTSGFWIRSSGAAVYWYTLPVGNTAEVTVPEEPAVVYTDAINCTLMLLELPPVVWSEAIAVQPAGGVIDVISVLGIEVTQLNPTSTLPAVTVVLVSTTEDPARDVPEAVSADVIVAARLGFLTVNAA